MAPKLGRIQDAESGLKHAKTIGEFVFHRLPLLRRSASICPNRQFTDQCTEIPSFWSRWQHCRSFLRMRAASALPEVICRKLLFDKQLHQATRRLRAPTRPLREATPPLRAATRPLRAATRRLRAPTRPLRAPTRPLRAATRQLRAATRPLRAPTRRLRAATRRLRAATRQLRAPTGSLLNSTRPLRAATRQLRAPTGSLLNSTRPLRAATRPLRAFARCDETIAGSDETIAGSDETIARSARVPLAPPVRTRKTSQPPKTLAKPVAHRRTLLDEPAVRRRDCATGWHLHLASVLLGVEQSNSQNLVNAYLAQAAFGLLPAGERDDIQEYWEASFYQSCSMPTQDTFLIHRDD